MSAAPTPLLYFGKLPSRGDFVRSHHSPVLIKTLDRWLTGGVEQLAADPRWKLLYDRAAPLHFAFLGSRSPKGIAGHLMASTDASGRRFPFLTAGLVESASPAAFLSRSPLLLDQAWQLYQHHARQAHGALDAEPALAALAHTEVAGQADAAQVERGYVQFLETQTVGSLQALLAAAGHELTLRSVLLGLGLLLEPVPASGASRLEKGLQLPLPVDPLYATMVATLWMDLIAGFLTRADFELSIFIPQPLDITPPSLSIGFDGASAEALRGLLDPSGTDSVFIDTRQADWVEDYVEKDYAAKKLSSYLKQPGLSLQLAVSTFKEVFLGL